MTTATQELIIAVRNVCDYLESGGDYCWYNRCLCICGLIAQTLGVKKQEIKEAGIGSWSLWANRMLQREAEGIPTGRIYERLKSLGLDANVIKELEHCKNTEVRERLNLKYIDYSCETKSVDEIVDYLRTWIEILLGEMKNGART